MGTSPSTVKRGWLVAKTWIRRRLDGRARRMNSERWAQITELFNDACELPVRASEWRGSTAPATMTISCGAEVAAMLRDLRDGSGISGTGGRRPHGASRRRWRRADRPACSDAYRLVARDRPRRHGRGLRGAARRSGVRPARRRSRSCRRGAPPTSSSGSASSASVLAGLDHRKHRAPDRRRHDRRRRAVLRDGVRGRAADGRVLPRTRARHRGSRRADRTRAGRSDLRAPATRDSPRHQARQHSGDGEGRAQAARLRDRGRCSRPKAKPRAPARREPAIISFTPSTRAPSRSAASASAPPATSIRSACCRICCCRAGGPTSCDGARRSRRCASSAKSIRR